MDVFVSADLCSFIDGSQTLLDSEQHGNQDLTSTFGGSDVDVDVQILPHDRPTAASPTHTANQQQHVLLHSQSEVSNRPAGFQRKMMRMMRVVRVFTDHSQRSSEQPCVCVCV